MACLSSESHLGLNFRVVISARPYCLNLIQRGYDVSCLNLIQDVIFDSNERVDKIQLFGNFRLFDCRR